MKNCRDWQQAHRLRLKSVFVLSNVELKVSPAESCHWLQLRKVSIEQANAAIQALAD
jgi:hypothetical protein